MPSTFARVAAVLQTVLGAATVAGCGSHPPAVVPPAPAAPGERTPPVAVAENPVRAVACILLAPPAQPPDTVTIVITDSIDPAHVPNARNPIEQLLFDRLYDPLARIDCTGAARAAAAERWSADTTGRTWTVTLAAGQRTWTGAAMTAADVVAGWGDVRALGIETAAAIDDRHLIVTLASPSTATPPVFGAPALAVRRSDPGIGWPEGTGSYRPASTAAGVTVAVPTDGAPGTPGPVIAFRRWPGRDLRDALDGGADVLVTDEPAAIAYAGTRAGFDVIPLTWDRTYVLVSAAPDSLDGTQRAALARDAVDVDAQAAAPPFWWSERGCSGANVRSPGTPAARVVYPREDRIAGRIAERLVALKVGGTRAITVGLDRAEFAASLGAGRDAAYVLPLPKQPLATCDDVPRWPLGSRAEPLIDTRRHIIVRRGTTGISTDAAGRLRLELR